MHTRRVEVVLDRTELSELDRVASERGSSRSEVLRAGLRLLSDRPAAPMTAVDVVSQLERHVRAGRLSALLMLARIHGLHRRPSQPTPPIVSSGPTSAALAECDALRAGARAGAG